MISAVFSPVESDNEPSHLQRSIFRGVVPDFLQVSETLKSKGDDEVIFL